MTTKTTTKISRRAFTKTFAGLSAAASVQFTGLLRDAFAQTPAPLRLIVLTQPHGKTVLWNPRAPGGGYGSAGETGWTLDFPNSSLAPLEKHKDSLVIIEGLDFFSLRQNSIGHQGSPAALTGTDIRSNDDRRPTGPSLDTAVARHLQVEPFVFYAEGTDSACRSWDATGSAFPDVGAAGGYDPVNGAYKRLFGSLATPGTAPDPRAQRTRAAELSALKFLRGDARTLRARLAAPERLKLDLHLEALDAMEKKLMAPVAGAGCRKPTAPAGGRDYLLGMEARHKLVMEMIAASFACNLTRVATHHMGANSSYPGVPGHAHNDVAHGSAYGDERNANTILSSTVHRWCATMTAYLIDQLKSFSEAGKSIYDNTIIVWTNELGNAKEHHTWNAPFVLAGGGGAWAKGRYLKMRDVTISAAGVNSKGGEAAAHNRLLVSIANQFGIADQSFGDKAITGPLRGL